MSVYEILQPIFLNLREIDMVWLYDQNLITNFRVIAYYASVTQMRFTTIEFGFKNIQEFPCVPQPGAW